MANSTQEGTDRLKKSKHERKRQLKAQKKATKKQMKKNWPRGKKIRRFILKLILDLSILAILIAGVIGIFTYLNIIQIPIVSNMLEKTGIKQEIYDFSEQEINDSSENNISPSVEDIDKNSSAYEKYLVAVENTTGSGSWSEQLTLNADIAVAYDGGKTKTKMTLNSNSNITDYVEDNLSQIKISSLTNMEIMGQEYDWSTEYKNGVAQYHYTKPVEKSQSIEIDPTFFEFNSIAYEAILDEENEGNQIHFTLSGDKMTEIGIAALKQISGINDLQYGDIDVIVFLDENENIEEIDMSFSASMEYQGYDADVDYEIQYNFS